MPFLSSLKTRLRQNRSVQQSRKELLFDLDAAAIRLQEAVRYFDAVSDEALVVSAIHELESASAAPASAAPQEDDQLCLTDVGGSQIAEELRTLDLNTITPIEAMNLLFELQKKARG